MLTPVGGGCKGGDAEFPQIRWAAAVNISLRSKHPHTSYKAVPSALAGGEETVTDLAEEILKGQRESIGKLSPDDRAMLVLSRGDTVSDANLGRICMAFFDSVGVTEPVVAADQSP